MFNEFDKINLDVTGFFIFIYKTIGIDKLLNAFRMKTYISNLVRTTRSWSNIHQVRSKSTDWKVK